MQTTFLFNMAKSSKISFDQFYKAYPRKVGRYAAEKSFKRLAEKEKTLAIEGLSNYIKHWEANKTEKQFIPHPSTWINQKRWEDELEDLKEVVESEQENETLQKIEQSEGAEEHEVKEALASFFKKRRKWNQN